MTVGYPPVTSKRDGYVYQPTQLRMAVRRFLESFRDSIVTRSILCDLIDQARDERDRAERALTAVLRRNSKPYGMRPLKYPVLCAGCGLRTTTYSAGFSCPHCGEHLGEAEPADKVARVKKAAIELEEAKERASKPGAPWWTKKCLEQAQENYNRLSPSTCKRIVTSCLM